MMLEWLLQCGKGGCRWKAVCPLQLRAGRQAVGSHLIDKPTHLFFPKRCLISFTLSVLYFLTNLPISFDSGSATSDWLSRNATLF